MSNLEASCFSTRSFYENVLKPENPGSEYVEWIKTVEIEEGFEASFAMKLVGIEHITEGKLPRFMRLMTKSFESILESFTENQCLEIVYSLNPDKAGLNFACSIYGVCQAHEADAVFSEAAALLANCASLRFKCGLKFEMESQAELSPFANRFQVLPQGFLLSKKLDKLTTFSPKSPIETISILPPFYESREFSLYDSFCLINEPVRVVISLGQRVLKSQELQVISRLRERTLECRVLPKRFITKDVDIERLKDELQQWQFRGWGFRLQLYLESHANLSLAAKNILGSAFFPGQELMFKHCKGDSERYDSGGVDLRGCYYRFQYLPQILLSLYSCQQAGLDTKFSGSKEKLPDSGIKLGISGDQEVFLGDVNEHPNLTHIGIEY